MTVSAGYTAAAALAGAATVLEMTKAGLSAMEILGWRRPERTMLSAAEKTFNCHLWIGFTWRPCVLGMAGDLLVLSGRFVEEARLMESAHVSVQDFYASVALLVGDPLQLCFHSAEEAQSFAMEVTKRACLKKDMMKLADQAKDLRESLSSATLSSDRSKQNPSSRSSRRPSKTAEKQKEAQAQAQALRTRLAVPKGVPMYTLSPCASGDLHVDEIPRLPVPSFKAPALAPPPVAPLTIPRESSESSLQAEMPKNPQIPTLKINRANSCPSPSKLQLSGDSSTASLSSDFAELARRGSTGSLGDGDDGGRFGAERTSLRRHSETPQMLITSPRDPESFASKVFMGLGLDSAKASLVAQKRVDVLKTKFEAAKGNSSCSSSPSMAPSV